MSALSIPDLPATLNQEFNIETEEAAKVLLDTRYRRVLTFFAAQENTITALARHLEVSVANAYYYVKVLSRLGILNVTTIQKRAGKALRYYTCSADSYFIPNRVAPVESIRAFFAAAEAPWREQLERSIEQHVYEREEWGLRFFRDDVGNLHTAFTPQKDWRDWDWLEHDFLPDGAALFAAVVPLSLKRSQAKALQAELGRLFQKYYIDTLMEDADTVAEPSYVMRLELAPVPTT